MSKDTMKFDLLPFKNQSYSLVPFVKNNKVIEISKYQINRINTTVEIPNLTGNKTFFNTLQSGNDARIASLFNIRDSKVLDFITSDSDLADLLIEANKQVRKWFTSENLRLDFIDDMPSKLQLSISVSLSDYEAFSKFDEFNEKWWFPCSKQATKYLFIVLDFQN